MSKYSYPLFFENEKKLNLGKNNDQVSFQKCQITFEDDTFKLMESVETKSEKKIRKYTGKPYDEETSKYIYLKFNENTNYFEAYPIEKWFLFKKDMPAYQGISIEEYEKKKRQGDKIANLLKNKNSEPQKKTRKKKADPTKANFLPAKEEDDNNDNYNNNSNDSDNEKYNNKKVELSHSSEEDPNLKDCSIDEEYNEKGKERENDMNNNLNNDELNNSNDSYDFSDEDDDGKENLTFDNENSDIDEEEEISKEILGKKTKRVDNVSLRKENMSDCLDNMLLKNKKMTYERIAKEMEKEFTKEEIEEYLPDILDKNTTMMVQDGDTYYFKN